MRGEPFKTPFRWTKNKRVKCIERSHTVLCVMYLCWIVEESDVDDSGLYISREMDWLKSSLSASTARFKFIMNSVPIIDFNDLIGEVEAIDRWQGVS